MVEEFLFYSSYFSYAAEAGLERARSLYPAIATSASINTLTIVNRPATDVAIANITRSFDTAYEHLWHDGQTTSAFGDAFAGLAEYILESTGKDINTFLEDEGIQVNARYATLANIFGQEIESANIES